MVQAVLLESAMIIPSDKQYTGMTIYVILHFSIIGPDRHELSLINKIRKHICIMKKRIRKN